MLLVEDGFFAHIDFKAFFARRELLLKTLLFGRRIGVVFAFHKTDEVAHLALEGYIGHQPVAGFGVQARQVAGVGVAVGVAVFHVKNQHEVIAAVQAHTSSP